MTLLLGESNNQKMRQNALQKRTKNAKFSSAIRSPTRLTGSMLDLSSLFVADIVLSSLSNLLFRRPRGLGIAGSAQRLDCAFVPLWLCLASSAPRLGCAFVPLRICLASSAPRLGCAFVALQFHLAGLVSKAQLRFWFLLVGLAPKCSRQREA